MAVGRPCYRKIAHAGGGCNQGRACEGEWRGEKKAAREAKAGELVTARIEMMTRTLRVIDAPRSRVGAKLVAQYAGELTPPEEFAKRRDPNFRPVGLRPKGAGRPTKRARRLLDESGF